MNTEAGFQKEGLIGGCAEKNKFSSHTQKIRNVTDSIMDKGRICIPPKARGANISKKYNRPSMIISQVLVKEWGADMQFYDGLALFFLSSA
jgi:hypothetical protein